VAEHVAIKSQLLCQLSYAPTVGILAGKTNKNYSIRRRILAGAKPTLGAKETANDQESNEAARKNSAT